MNESAIGHIHPVNEDAVVISNALQKSSNRARCACRWKTQELVEVKEGHPCVLPSKTAIAVVVCITLGSYALAVTPVNNGNEIIGNKIAEHRLKTLLAVVVVVVDINMVEAEGLIM